MLAQDYYGLYISTISTISYSSDLTFESIDFCPNKYFSRYLTATAMSFYNFSTENGLESRNWKNLDKFTVR